MASADIDSYLATVEDPKRSTLQALREIIRDRIPDAQEGLAYGVPAFTLEGKVVAGFAAFKNHLSYLPHSGWVLSRLAEELEGYQRSKGALRFAIDRPLPKPLVGRLIDMRLKEIRDGRSEEPR